MEMLAYRDDGYGSCATSVCVDDTRQERSGTTTDETADDFKTALGDYVLAFLESRPREAPLGRFLWGAWPGFAGTGSWARKHVIMVEDSQERELGFPNPWVAAYQNVRMSDPAVLSQDDDSTYGLVVVDVPQTHVASRRIRVRLSELTRKEPDANVSDDFDHPIEDLL